MWILDIWPDSMIFGGNIKNEHIIKAVTSIVMNVYNNCDKILISSLKFKELVKLQGVDDEKIIYFPNWSDDILNMPQKEINFSTSSAPSYNLEFSFLAIQTIISRQLFHS